MAIDLDGVLQKCSKYDMKPQEVESCFPNGIKHIKKLYTLLRQCEESGKCHDHGAGFVKSFINAIEMANVNFENEINKYITEVKKIKQRFALNKNTYTLESDVPGMEADFSDKELYKLYKNYYDAIGSMQLIAYLKDDKMRAVTLDQLEDALDKYTEAALALCLFVGSQSDAAGVYNGKCTDFKIKRK